MCRMYGSDSEMLLRRGNHKLASFTLVEDCNYALIRIKPALWRIVIFFAPARVWINKSSIAQGGAGVCSLTHLGRAVGAVAYPRRISPNVRRRIDMVKEFL